ncbi:MAG: TIGR01212 family radical SAM protein [Thermodesulfobacteriota bacterium]|nr:TIGR01212 family radical SAM protein [Thermodesulfobacteriota bacterium]
MRRYYSLSTYFRARFGRRVQKVPLDAGFTCPNRDGTLSKTGCVFCNPLGSGTGLSGSGPSNSGMTLAEQWDFWLARLSKKYKAASFLAYLQSFSNTYGPLERLREALEEMLALPGLVGICLGTRPDCLDREKIALLASLPVQEVWLEIGLQSANNQTLKRINRGHDREAFARAAHMAAKQDLNVCAHVIAGLPGETLDDFLATVEFLNRLPVRGVKFHNLYVCQGATLAAWWRRGEFEPLSREEYVAWLVSALPKLRPDIVLHRLGSDPKPDELLAPDWASDKQTTLNNLDEALETLDTWQGKSLFPDRETPAWFAPDVKPPGVFRAKD